VVLKERRRRRREEEEEPEDERRKMGSIASENVVLRRTERYKVN